MLRCLRYGLLMLALATPVQAEPAIADVASRILSLCGACQALLVGERHQQAESPALFIQLVARLVERGERIVVGLEIPATRQDALDAVVAGARGPAGIAHPIIDSPAFQRLLMDLAGLTQTYSGLVTVAAIDDTESQRPRDEAMAAHIQRHLASGEVARVVALVGNLHTIRMIQWDKDAGRQPPYLAERLLHADIAVTSVMQDFGESCAQPRRPAFYLIEEGPGLEAIGRQLGVLNHHANMDKRRSSDGMVIWTCQSPC